MDNNILMIRFESIFIGMDHEA